MIKNLQAIIVFVSVVIAAVSSDHRNAAIWLIVLVGVIPTITMSIYKWLQKRKFEKRLSRSGIRDIDKMDGFQFEYYLKALLRQMGYKPQVTQSSNDFGADVILKGKNKIVIQAKRYGLKNKVGIDAVQQIFAAKYYYDAEEAWVVTNSKYTSGAEKLAKKCNVKLIDRTKLQDFILEVNPEKSASEVRNAIDPAPRKCKCGHELVVRMSKNKNKFFGCSQYPACTHTERIAQ